MSKELADYELNALIARRIIGCETVRVGVDNRLVCSCKGLVHGGDTAGHIPGYCTNINAAFLVVERLRGMGIWVLMMENKNWEWDVKGCANEGNDECWFGATNKSLPRAICLAAIEVNNEQGTNN